jgi:CRP-like cAMP-binding protein
MMQRMTDILTQVDLFHEVPRACLRSLVGDGRVRTFAAGSHLTHQGDPAEALYVILGGRVRVERQHPHMAEPVAMLERGPGEVVGAQGVLDRAPRPDSAVAATETEVLELSAASLALAVVDYPEECAVLLRTLSARAHRRTALIRPEAGPFNLATGGEAGKQPQTIERP